ncbi:MAG: hypothetical protein JEZ09_18460, partial [Salinivirgaceae bacterium]|nr:hypothetical protein [Salinivirgaceae bacterium]
MKTLWRKLSYLGIIDTESTLDQRSNILTNQINVILSIAMITLMITMKTERMISHKTMSFGSLRIFLLFALTLLNLILA